MLQIFLAFVHLLALPIGLPSVLGRARALGQAAREPAGRAALDRAFAADTSWGVSAILWIGSGVWRYVAGTEKSAAYYNANRFFVAKMSLLAAVVLLEIWPMVTLIRWRIAIRRGAPAEAVASSGVARRIAAVSYLQGALVVLMVFLAVGLARGVGS